MQNVGLCIFGPRSNVRVCENSVSSTVSRPCGDVLRLAQVRGRRCCSIASAEDGWCYDHSKVLGNNQCTDLHESCRTILEDTRLLCRSGACTAIVKVASLILTADTTGLQTKDGIVPTGMVPVATGGIGVLAIGAVKGSASGSLQDAPASNTGRSLPQPASCPDSLASFQAMPINAAAGCRSVPGCMMNQLQVLLSRLVQRLSSVIPKLRFCELANVILAMAKLRICLTPRLLNDIATHAQECIYKVPYGREEELVKVLYAYALATHWPRPRVLLTVVVSKLRRRWIACSAKSCALAAWALARLQTPDAAVALTEMLPHTTEQLERFTPQGLAMVMHASAVMQVPLPTGWLKAFYAASLRGIDQFQGQDVAMVMWSLVVLDLSPPIDWLAELHNAAAAAAESISPQGTAVMLWALTSLPPAPGGTQLLHKLIGCLHDQVPQMSSIGVTMCVWALAKLHCRVPEAVAQRLAAAAANAASAGAMQPWALTMCLWAAATSQRQEAWAIQHVRSIAAACLPTMSSFSLQHAVLVGWALTKLRVKPGGKWLSSWQAVVMEELRSGAASPREVALALRCSLGLRARLSAEQLAMMASVLRACLSQASPLSLCMAAWAFARMKHRPGAEWLRDMVAASVLLLPYFSPQGLAVLVWAFARLGATPGEAWTSAFGDVSLALLPQFSTHHIAITCWAAVHMRLRLPLVWHTAMSSMFDNQAASAAATDHAIMQKLRQQLASNQWFGVPWQSHSLNECVTEV